MTSQPKLSEICSLLGSSAQSHLFAKHVLPLLDTLDLPEDTRLKLLQGAKVVKARWDRFPKFDYQQRKVEIADLLLRLGKNTRFTTSEEGIEDQNEILVELVWAILEWTKQLWIVGVEFAEEGEFVHESLSFLLHSLIGFAESSMTHCTCIIPSIDVEHVFERTDGAVVEEFRGRAGCVVRGALLQVWRDMMLANLVKPENASDSSHFVKNLLPAFLNDIVEMSRRRTSTLLRLLDPHSGHNRPDGRCGHRGAEEGDDDYDDHDDGYGDGEDDEDDEDEDEGTDDDMPPLVDVAESYAEKKKPVQAAGEDEDDEMPPLVSVSESSSEASSGRPSKARKGKGPTNASSGESSEDTDSEEEEEEGEGEWTDTDGSESESNANERSPISRELDEEEHTRLAARPRLRRLVLAHILETVKRHPTIDDFQLITSRRTGIKTELVHHFLAMKHDTASFDGVVKILVGESLNAELVALLNANRACGRRSPKTMQDAILHLLSNTSSPKYRELAAKLLRSEVHLLLSTMVVEVEFSFQGLRVPEKKREVMEFNKIPAAERPGRAKAWVHDVMTPVPESLSAEAQENVGPDVQDPIGLLAALSASLGLPTQPNAFGTPLYSDPIEALNPDLSDPEVQPLVERFRPNYSRAFTGWLAVLAEAAKRNSAMCGALALALSKDLMGLAPYLCNSVLVGEMKAHCESDSRKHIRDILSALHSFVAEQRKLAAAKKAKEKKTAPKPSSNPSAPAPAPAPAAASPSPSSTASYQAIPATLFTLLGMTVPGDLFGPPPTPPGGNSAPASNQPWDDVD